MVLCQNRLAVFCHILFELPVSSVLQLHLVKKGVKTVSPESQTGWYLVISIATHRLRSCQSERVKLHREEFNNRLQLRAGAAVQCRLLGRNLFFLGINRVQRTHSLARESVQCNKWAGTLWLSTARMVDIYIFIYITVVTDRHCVCGFDEMRLTWRWRKKKSSS